MLKLFKTSTVQEWQATAWWKPELEIIQDDITAEMVRSTGKKHAQYRNDLMALFSKIEECIQKHDKNRDIYLSLLDKKPRRKNGKNMNTIRKIAEHLSKELKPNSKWGPLSQFERHRAYVGFRRNGQYYQLRIPDTNQNNVPFELVIKSGTGASYFPQGQDGIHYRTEWKILSSWNVSGPITAKKLNKIAEEAKQIASMPTRKNGTDMKYEIKINKTQQTALRNYFSGSPELSAMYVLADKAKKKTKSATVMTFMATDMFVDALVRELENATRYTSKMNDRDFQALRKLRQQVKKMGLKQPLPRRLKNGKSEAQRAMEMHHNEGFSLKDAWAIVKGEKKNPSKRKNGKNSGGWSIFDNYTIERPNYMQSGRIHIMYRGKQYSGDLNAGADDRIKVFRAVGEPNVYYVYSENTRMPYVGLQVMERTSTGMETVGEIFFQEWQVEDALGRRWEDRTELTNAKKLSQYVYNNNPRRRKNAKNTENYQVKLQKQLTNVFRKMKLMFHENGITILGEGQQGGMNYAELHNGVEIWYPKVCDIRKEAQKAKAKKEPIYPITLEMMGGDPCSDDGNYFIKATLQDDGSVNFLTYTENWKTNPRRRKNTDYEQSMGMTSPAKANRMFKHVVKLLKQAKNKIESKSFIDLGYGSYWYIVYKDGSTQMINVDKKTGKPVSKIKRKRKNAKSEAQRAMDMHHQEGISLKDAWAIVKGKKKPKRKNGTKKGQVRKTARRAYMKKNPNTYSRKRGSHGRMMYFKNGKICSKETYTKKL